MRIRKLNCDDAASYQELRLLDAAIAHARSIALRQLKLTVTATNSTARHLYVSRGFLRVGIEPEALCSDGRYYDEEIYVLRFAEPSAAPNGGPAASVDNPNAPGGPPSVS
jgi:hypothetical protein